MVREVTLMDCEITFGSCHSPGLLPKREVGDMFTLCPQLICVLLPSVICMHDNGGNMFNSSHTKY